MPAPRVTVTSETHGLMTYQSDVPESLVAADGANFINTGATPSKGHVKVTLMEGVTVLKQINLSLANLAPGHIYYQTYGGAFGDAGSTDSKIAWNYDASRNLTLKIEVSGKVSMRCGNYMAGTWSGVGAGEVILSEF